MAVSNEDVSVICGFDAVGDVGADDVIVGDALGEAEGVVVLLLGCTVAGLGLWPALDVVGRSGV